MNHKISLSSLLGVLLSLNAASQIVGIYGAANTNFVREHSDYTMNNSSLTPLISYSMGAYIRTKKANKFGLISFLDYSRLSNKNNSVDLLSGNGEHLASIEANVHNHYLSVSGLGLIQFTKLYTGVGITGSVLIGSKTKMKNPETSGSSYYSSIQLKEALDGTRYKNTQYSRAILSIPLLIGRTIDNWDLMARINIGITNRLEGETFVKEFNNSIQIGVGYTFSIKKDAVSTNL